MAKKGVFRKGVVLAIICYFVGVGVLEVAGINTSLNSMEIRDEQINHCGFLINKAIQLDMLGNSCDNTNAIFNAFTFNQVSYKDHEPIYIHGNENFTEENGVTSGKGTAEDPYIIENWDIKCDFQDGIVIRNVSIYFIIKNCYIHDGSIKKDGIVFYNVTNGTIEYNFITMNRNGVMFRAQYPGKENSNNNKISYNSIINNTNDGINFEHTVRDWHSMNNISSNDILGNNRGIYMIMSSENSILYNIVISNDGYGLQLDRCMGGGEHNIIHHNNFFNNKGEEGQVCEWGNPLNYWNDSYPSGGNYWYDYMGDDEYHGSNQDLPGSDGIGDSPYDIPEGNNQDMYPLMEPYGDINLPPSAPIVTGPTSGKVYTSYTYTFTSIDPDGDDICYYIEWGDGITTTWTAFKPSGSPGYSESHSWNSEGIYTIKVKAKDTNGLESDWAELSVSMSRNKPYTYRSFLKFLNNIMERFPSLAELLQLPVFNLIDN
jgi:parallel beta-helix repeat protein